MAASDLISLGIGSPAGIRAFLLFGLSIGAAVPEAPVDDVILSIAGSYTPLIAMSGSGSLTIAMMGSHASLIDADGSAISQIPLFGSVE